MGERHDADAGLQYLNARYYDTRLGLFIQPDWSSPVARGVGTNRFAYSGNDPVNQLDPSGLSFLSDLWDAVKGDGSFEATFGSKTHVGLKNFADNLDIGINLGSGNLYGAASGFSPSQALLPDVQELSDDDFGSADVLEIVGLVPTGKLAKPISEMLPSGWKKATNRTRLIDGLVANGARITPGNVVDIRSINGRTVWLETGNSSAGLQHIVGKHGPEFAQRGILETQIPDFVFAALKRNNVVGYQGRGTGRPIYEFDYGGQTHQLAITVGDNGFIVGANFR